MIEPMDLVGLSYMDVKDRAEAAAQLIVEDMEDSGYFNGNAKASLIPDVDQIAAEVGLGKEELLEAIRDVSRAVWLIIARR